MECKNSLFNLKYNIIQAPMAGGIVNPSLVASVCNAGMLGSIPAGYLTITALEKFIFEVKQLTSKPFIVNLFNEPLRTKEQVFQKSHTIKALEKKLGSKQVSETFSVPATINEEDYINLLIKEKVPIVSTTFGFLNKNSIKRLKDNNIKIVGNATTSKEFTYLIANGADAVILQGFEAGGHQGSFLSDCENKSTTLELLKLVRKHHKETILIVAGGVSTKNMANFFTAGANYIQLGTTFMLTKESKLPEHIKEYILNKKVTSISKSITGRYARGIRNNLMAVLDKVDSNDIFSFPVQHYHTSEIRKLAKQVLNPEYSSVWAGENPDNLKIQLLNDLIVSLQDKYKQIFH